MATRKPLVIGVDNFIAELTASDTLDPAYVLSLGTTAQFLRGDGSWSNTLVGNFTAAASTTETRSLGIGTGRTGDGASELNFVGDATNTGYALRLRREGGVNGNSELRHLGNGSLYFNAIDNGAIMLRQNSVNRLGLLTSGEVYGALEADVYPNDNAGTVQWFKIAQIVPSASANCNVMFTMTGGGIGGRRLEYDTVTLSARGYTTVTALSQSNVDGMVSHIRLAMTDVLNGPLQIGVTIDAVDGSGNATLFGFWIRRDTYNHGHKITPLATVGSTWLGRDLASTQTTTEPSGIVYATPRLVYHSGNNQNYTALSFAVSSTARLLGRSSASAGPAEEISLGSNLSLSGGVLDGKAGTVTSVGISGPSQFSFSTAVTTSGTLSFSWNNVVANQVLASPNGSSGAPTFRALVAADVPTLNQSTTGSAATLTTARTLTIGGTGKTFNGSANVSWSIAEIFSASQTANTFFAAPNGSAGAPTFRAMVAADVPTLNQNTTGSAATLTTARTINGTSFNGSANITTANWGTARNLTIGNTAKSVDGSAAVAWSMAELGIVGANLFINGKMDFWQRGTTTGSGTGAAFAADRWKRDNGGTGAMALIRQSFGIQTAVPGNPTYYLNANVASSSGTASYQRFQQIVEDVASLSGLTVTLSFYAKGTAGTKVAIECEQMFGSGGSASVQTAVQTITLTASWALYTMTWTVPSVSGKTVGNNNGTAITFWVSAGTDYSARVPGLGLQTGNFDFALFQLETGSQATPFEQRQYALELILCQRYYEVCNGNRLAGVTYTGNGDTRGARIPFITQKRIAPALTQTGSLNVIAAGPSGDVVNVSLGTLTLVSSVQMAFISIISNYAAFTSCGNVMGWGDNGVNAYTVYADAEL